MARRATASRRSKASAISMPDMSKVESATVIPADDYLLKVADVEDGEGDKGAYLKWTFEVADGKYEGKKPKPHITSFAKEALFNLKNVLTALGVDIPDEEFDIEKEELIGLECMGTIEHDTYQGRKQSVIVDFFEADEADEKPAKRGKKDDEDDRPSRRGAKEAPAKRGKKDEPAKVAQSEIEDMSQEELEDFLKEHDLDVDLSEFKTLRKMKAAVVDAATEADLIED